MLRFLLFLAALSTASAACPNDCSGNGACNKYSACECMRNWMGADCSQRACLFARSYIDTPQGDLNADGFVDKSTVKSVILGGTTSFWKKDDGSDCDGTGCTCLAPSCVKYKGSDSSGTSTFTTFYAKTSTLLVTGATDSSPSATTFTESAATTAAVAGQYLLSECPDKTKFARKIASVSGAIITTGANMCGSQSIVDASFVGKGAAIFTAVVTTIKSDIFPADEFTKINDPYNFISDCNTKFGDAATQFAIKVDVDATFVGPEGTGYSMDTDSIAMSVTEFTPNAVDITGTVKVNPLLSVESDGVATSQMRVCAVSSTTFPTQWSPNKEWELFPDDHGLAKGDGAKNRWDEAHFFKECAGKGKCDRSTGLCECYPGWYGSGCIRTACPENCSGHGFCKSIADQTDTYLAWDATNSQHCHCEPGYEGADCSLRSCPKGHDPIHRGMADEVQTIKLETGSMLFGPGTKGADASMALIFTDEFNDQWVTESFLPKPAVKAAVISSGLIPLQFTDGNMLETDKAKFIITDPGTLKGGLTDLNLVASGNTDCSGTPQLVFEEGKGMTSINFAGLVCSSDAQGTALVLTHTASTAPDFHGGAANMAKALENLPNNVIPFVTVSAHSVGLTHPADANAVEYRITFTHNSGDIPALGVRFGNPVVRGDKASAVTVGAQSPQAWIHDMSGTKTHIWSCNGGTKDPTRGVATQVDSTDTSKCLDGGWHTGFLTIAKTTAGTKKNDVCSNRGICDFGTGQCKCFGGYTDVDCHTQNALSIG